MLLTLNRKTISDDMEYNLPNKKMRLDCTTADNSDNPPNDELWGDEDITADDFDYATQQIHGSMQPLPNKSWWDVPSTSTNVSQTLDDPVFKIPILPPFSSPTSASQQNEYVRQQQYELEGKVKFLTESLSKVSKTLIEERLTKEEIITIKNLENKEHEKQMNSKLKKMESALEFKDLEMKSLYEKISHLQSNNEVKRAHPELPKISPKKFVKKLECENIKSFIEEPSAMETSSRTGRKYKLALHSSLGQVDITSSILSSRLTFLSSSPFTASPGVPDAAPCLSMLTLARTDPTQKLSELLDHCCRTLEQYVTLLKNVPAKTTCQLLSPQSKKKDLLNNQAVVICALKDTAFLVSCAQFKGLLNQWDQDHQDTENSTKDSGSSSSSHETSEKSFPLLQTLIALANGNSYPANYSKAEVVKWAFSALAAWSNTDVEYLKKMADFLPIHSFLVSTEDSDSLLICLKFMSRICIYKEFRCTLIHKDACIICSVADLLCSKTSRNHLSELRVLLMIQNFLSGVFSTHKISELLLETAPCSSVVIKGIILSLWRFLEQYTGDVEVTQLLLKGFLLLFLLSRNIRSFKERRFEVEKVYILLVSRMFALSKENPAFKHCHDFIPELWDFQEDFSELEIDDQSSDSSPEDSRV